MSQFFYQKKKMEPVAKKPRLVLHPLEDAKDFQSVFARSLRQDDLIEFSLKEGQWRVGKFQEIDEDDDNVYLVLPCKEKDDEVVKAVRLIAPPDQTRLCQRSARSERSM